MAETAPAPTPPPPGDPAASASAPLPYYAGAPAVRRAPVWRLAPARFAWLMAAWVAAVVALFLPGCDMSGSGKRTEVAPTYVVYGLTMAQLSEFSDQSRAVMAGDRSAIPETGGVAMTLACALFPLGSAAFVFTPLLLRRRVRGRFGWGSWTLSSLLLAPWALLLVCAAAGGGANYLYGYYLLAAAHTVAFLILLWPDRRVVR